jgi:hypothetical protein
MGYDLAGRGYSPGEGARRISRYRGSRRQGTRALQTREPRSPKSRSLVTYIRRLFFAATSSFHIMLTTVFRPLCSSTWLVHFNTHGSCRLYLPYRFPARSPFTHHSTSLISPTMISPSEIQMAENENFHVL